MNFWVKMFLVALGIINMIMFTAALALNQFLTVNLCVGLGCCVTLALGEYLERR